MFIIFLFLYLIAVSLSSFDTPPPKNKKAKPSSETIISISNYSPKYLSELYEREKTKEKNHNERNVRKSNSLISSSADLSLLKLIRVKSFTPENVKDFDKKK